MKSLLLGGRSVSLAVRLVGECLQISFCSMQTPCNHRNLVAVKATTRRVFFGGGGFQQLISQVLPSASI